MAAANRFKKAKKDEGHIQKFYTSTRLYRSPLVAFEDLKVAGGDDLLEGAGRMLLSAANKTSIWLL